MCGQAKPDELVERIGQLRVLPPKSLLEHTGARLNTPSTRVYRINSRFHKVNTKALTCRTLYYAEFEWATAHRVPQLGRFNIVPALLGNSSEVMFVREFPSKLTGCGRAVELQA